MRMKWFKHDSDAFMSEGVDALISNGGFADYGRWMRLLEIVSSKMDKTPRCHVDFSIAKWCSLLGLKQKKLSSFLKLTENKLKTKVVYYGNNIRIEIPNLLNKRDNYTKDLEETCSQLPSKEVEVEVEVDKEEYIIKEAITKERIKETITKENFLSDSIEVRLSELLLSLIKEHNPTHKQPNIQGWAKHIDMMIRIDKRVPDEIKEIIIACQKDNFWYQNILSTKTLRDKYDQLKIKLIGGYNGKNSRNDDRSGVLEALRQSGGRIQDTET